MILPAFIPACEHALIAVDAGSAGLSDLITSIEKLDPWTIRVHLKTAWSPFVATFFNQSGNPYPVLPAHLLAQYPNINRVEYNSKPIGIGPFRYTEWVRTDHVTLEANPYYWRGQPKIKKIIFKIIPDRNTLLTLWSVVDASTTRFMVAKEVSK